MLLPFSLSKRQLIEEKAGKRKGSTRGRESPRVGSNACKRAVITALCAAKRQIFGLLRSLKSEAL